MSFRVGDTNYSVTATNIDDSGLLRAAEHVRPADDGYGAVVDAPGLATGLAERAAGTMSEVSFIERTAREHPSPVSYWQRDGITFWIIAVAEIPRSSPSIASGSALSRTPPSTARRRSSRRWRCNRSTAA